MYQERNEIIYANLKRTAVHKGWTVAYICRKAGLSAETLRAQRARGSDIKLGTLQALASAAGVKVGTLLRGAV